MGTVRVHDAGQLPPTIPFWLGEAPARTMELSAEVSRLASRSRSGLIAQGRGRRPGGSCASGPAPSDEVADQVVAYLAAGRAALGTLPTQDRIVIERFFDDSEGTQLVIHAPFGGAINRALGLALRKRFCVVVRLRAAGRRRRRHRVPLARAPAQLPAVPGALDAAEPPGRGGADPGRPAPTPCSRPGGDGTSTASLVVPRSRNGQRRPIHLQRMEADDLLAATWPALAACQENAPAGPITGPRSRAGPPDRATTACARRSTSTVWSTCCERIESRRDRGALRRVGRALAPRPRHPDRSALHVPRWRAARGAAVPGRPDPAGPRRVPPGSRSSPTSSRPLEPAAVAFVLDQIAPDPRDPDELHDLLLSLVLTRPVTRWRAHFESLVHAGRATIDRRTVGRATERVAMASGHRRGRRSGRRPVCSGTSRWPGRSRSRSSTSERRFAVGTVRGAPISALRAKTALARLEARGQRDAASRRALVRRATSSSGCTRPAGRGGGAASSRPASPSSSSSWPAGSTSRPGPSSRAGPGCWR